jgi:predicted transcriptional regulator
MQFNLASIDIEEEFIKGFIAISGIILLFTPALPIGVILLIWAVALYLKGRARSYFLSSIFMLIAAPLLLILVGLIIKGEFGFGFGFGFFFLFFSLFFGLGIHQFFRARYLGKMDALRKLYIDLIENQGIASIDEIACVANVQSDDVMLNLRNMIDEGFFPGAFLDTTRKVIVWEEQYKKYIDLIENQGIASIDDISSITNVRDNVVVAYLQRMINAKVLPGARLDETQKVFVSARYVRYLDLIENRGITSISEIATITKTLSEDVMADLRKMLDKGFFPGASLDETKQVIVLARYEQYMDLIENQGVTLINDIAIKTGVGYEWVVFDLQRMIKADFFPGASLDTAKGTIVWVPQSVASAPGVVQIVQVQQAPQTPREKVIACPSCGANNKIMSGKVTECQYCGALIQ